ncbi:proteoglycan 3, pro eosinophil major basic protein 2 [Rhinolophus ferrumequinum]|nr:proteoglycan 3 [Rhinolophus ferrumequinum]KAF6334018.1 proteoglycan 3, pro eosinophil major basic protein 2 [Rhinolophus ferrumequinum]
MKHLLLLPLLLLGTVSALRLENDALSLDSGETQADLSQDLEGSGEQEGELALTKEVIQSEGEEVEPCKYPDAFEDEEAMESDPSALDKDFQCPREEDTVQTLGSPECKTCHYVLVRTPRTFRKAQNVCRRCYRGNLVSIHSLILINRIRCLTSSLNQLRVWIGGTYSRCSHRLHWIDGSCWNFGYWASGQPRRGRGHCVTLGTRGGHWRRACCRQRLPFICSY